MKIIRLLFVYILTLGLGVLLAFGISLLIGLILPGSGIFVFIILSICWLYVGWRYAMNRDRAKHLQTPKDCNFILARDEIAHCFSIANREAEKKGEYTAFPVQTAEAWYQFRDNPCEATANNLILASPGLYQYFEACSPGGTFYISNKLLPK